MGPVSTTPRGILADRGWSVERKAVVNAESPRGRGRPPVPLKKGHFTVAQIQRRWACSPDNVLKLLRKHGVELLGGRGGYWVRCADVRRLEKRNPVIVGRAQLRRSLGANP